MTPTEKILAEFGRKYTGIYKSPHVVQTFGGWNEEATVFNIRQFLKKAIQQALAEERARVRCNLPEIRVSRLSLLLDDCPNCGQVVNRSFVDDLTCRIQDEYKQKILSSLDKPLTDK